MGTPARIGRNEYCATLIEVRGNLQDLRSVLKQISHEGDNVVRALVGQAAMLLLSLNDNTSRLEEIGRNTKEL